MHENSNIMSDSLLNTTDCRVTSHPPIPLMYITSLTRY